MAERFTPVVKGSRAYHGEWVITSLLADRAERFADEIAIDSPDGDVSYAEVVERAGAVAGFLADVGVEPGDRVATMLETTIDYVAAWHGIVWRGAIDVPINAEYRGLFLEHVLADSGATALIVDGRWLERLRDLEIPSLRHVIVPGPPAAEIPAGLVTHDFADALAHDPVPRVEADERDTTYIIYTSGTTGPPKGAVHNHRSSVHYIMPFVEGLDLVDDDVCYSMFPLFHQMGRSSCTTTAFWVGNRLSLRKTFSASGFWEDIRRSGATWMGYFGAVIQLLWLKDPGPQDRDHKLTRAFGSNAAPEIFEAWQERFGVTLYEVYGSTEIGLGSGLGPGYGRKPRTMGLTCRQVEVQIVDDRDNPLPSGTVGESVWRPRYPDAIFQGYWNRPADTVEAWRNLWFHSGDAGKLDEDGYFTFVDRIKDSIRRRAENISTFVVEESVRRVDDGIKEIAAYAVTSDLASTEEEVMIAVVPKEGETIDVTKLFERLCETMPRHTVPRYLRFLDALPRTPTQRVRKFLLREEGVTPDSYDRVEMGIEPERA